MNIDFKNLRPPANYPVYPPYHTGDYLEEYFYKFYKRHKEEFDKTGYTLIPVFWTNVYITNVNVNLIQPYIDLLPAGKYFTVSQHDDAVKEVLPAGTISFEAGGNKNGIPIPLICSPLSKEVAVPTAKDIFCSFTGAITHDIRNVIYNMYREDRDFVFFAKNWSPTVSNNELLTFINTTKCSKFTLCPRGYGAQSFRLYEVLQLGSVPVIVYDKEWFPFSNEIDWSSFCILINVKEIPEIKNKLLHVSDEKYTNMLSVGRSIYEKYFTMDGMSANILKFLQQKL